MNVCGSPLAVVLLAVVACGEESSATTADVVRRDLVEGTSSEQVERFFAVHQIEHSVLHGPELEQESDLRDPRSRAGLDRRYVGIIRNVGVRWLIYSESIQIKVDVDELGRVRRVQVYEVYTGP